MSLRAAVLALLLIVPLGCAGAPRGGGSSKGSAVVKFDTSVKGGEVWINGSLVPGALRKGVEVPPGTYRIEVRNERYHTVYFEVTVKNGDTRTLEVRPAPTLP